MTTDCRKCRSYSRGWCNAVEARVLNPTGFHCTYYEGPADEDDPRCAGGCGDLVAEEGEWCLTCLPDDADHVDAELSADERRTP